VEVGVHRMPWCIIFCSTIRVIRENRSEMQLLFPGIPSEWLDRGETRLRLWTKTTTLPGNSRRPAKRKAPYALREGACSTGSGPCWFVPCPCSSVIGPLVHVPVFRFRATVLPERFADRAGFFPIWIGTTSDSAAAPVPHADAAIAGWRGCL
jgi:hypothetical protein